MWLLGAIVGDANPQATEPPDVGAVRRMAAGDPAALGAIYDAHIRAVYSLVLRILENRAEAEDAVQEVFAQAWRQADRYRADRGSVAAWLLTIARSRAIDRLRARRARPESARVAADTAAVDRPDPSRDPETRVLDEEAGRTLARALRNLPASQRVPIELAYYEGFTQAEIAQRLREPLGTVKTRIRTGLRSLRDALAGGTP